MWVTNIATDNAQRIDPDAGPVGGGGFPVGAVDLTVHLGAGAGPYNYSDMTGSVLGEITAPVGTWAVVQDGGAAGRTWGAVTWNTEPEGAEPAGTSITVEVRTPDTEAGLVGAAFTPAPNGALFTRTGRFIEVRATLLANAAGDSPVLSDLRVRTAERTGVFSCRATALEVAGIAFARANPPDVPCADGAVRVVGVGIPAGVLDVTADALTATTDRTPDDPAAAPPAAGDNASATARVERTRISGPLVTVELGVVQARASATCAPGPDGLRPEFTGSSTIASLRVNNVPIGVGSAPLTIPLVVGSLRLNSQTVSGGVITQRAVVLDTPLTDVVIGEAKANVEGEPATPPGNPCRLG